MALLKLIPDNTNIPFMRWRNVALALSLLLIAASLFSLFTRGLNLGVDFVGGQSIRATFPGPVPLDPVRDAIGRLNLGDASIQQAGTSGRVANIRVALPSDDPASAAAAVGRIRGAVEGVAPGVRFDAASAVSGKVSEELAWDGALALSLAILGIALYIWFRFEWQFGVGAITTLFHDVVITLGFFSITGLEVSLNIVAAFLTIVGYSLNDTVVVYDRIRENLRKYRRMGIVELIDLSLNETLSRTIVTSLSIILALAILLLVGPDVIFGLTAAILFGAVIGTYSTIYISAPMLIWLGVGPDSFLKTAEGSNKGAERVTAAERVAPLDDGAKV